MALDRNVEIVIVDYDNIKLNRQISLYEDNSILLDIVVKNLNLYFDINENTNLNVLIQLRNPLRSTWEIGTGKHAIPDKNVEADPIIPLTLQSDKTTGKFKFTLKSEHTKEAGPLEMLITIKDKDTCSISLPVIIINVKENLFNADDDDVFIIDHNDVVNEIVDGKEYDDDDTLGMKKAQELIKKVDTLNDNLESLAGIIVSMQKTIDGLVRKEDYTADKKATDTKFEEMVLNASSISGSVASLRSDFEGYRREDLENINTNFAEVNKQITALDVKSKGIDVNSQNLLILSNIIKNIIGDSSDSNLPTMKNYRLLKLKMGRSGQFEIDSISDSDITINSLDGIDLEVTFPKDIEGVFTTAITPYTRMQSFVKSINGKTAIVRVYNMEKVVEEIENEITGVVEQVVTWEQGLVNIHKLPVGFELQVVYLA